MKYTLSDLKDVPRFTVEIAPTSYDEDLLDIKRCIDVVNTSQVRVRGWYFPHINRETLSPGERNRFLMNHTEAHALIEHLEEWRLYRSGQFLYRSMIWDVPSEAVQTRMRSTAINWNFRGSDLTEVKGFLGFVGIIYSVSEAYVFAAHLAQAIPFSSDIDITVALRSVKGWALGSHHDGIYLDNPYVSLIDNAEHSATVSIDELISRPLELAVAAIVEIFQQFRWFQPSPQMIANWQREIFR